MLTHTGMLTVNAAFLKDLKDDNLHLQELLSAVNDALLQVDHRPIHAGLLAELLGELRDQLATHFSLEEFFGYFHDAIDVAPRLSVQADILRSQHESLFSEICEIVDDAESLAYGEANARPVSLIAASYRIFHDKLNAHEICERELIMDALYEDIGVAD